MFFLEGERPLLVEPLAGEALGVDVDGPRRVGAWPREVEGRGESRDVEGRGEFSLQKSNMSYLNLVLD